MKRMIERYPGLGEDKCLLAAAAEDERVATLQANHVEPGAAELEAAHRD